MGEPYPWILVLGGVETPAGDIILAASSLTLGEAAGLVKTEEDSFLENVLVDRLGSGASSSDVEACLVAILDLVTLGAGSCFSEDDKAAWSDVDCLSLTFSLETFVEAAFWFLAKVRVDRLG